MKSTTDDSEKNNDTALKAIKWAMIISPFLAIYEALNLYLGPEKIFIDERYPTLFEERHRFFGDWAAFFQCYVYWGVPALIATGIFYCFTRRKSDSYMFGIITGIISMVLAITLGIVE